MKKSERIAVVKDTLRTLLGWDCEEPDRIVCGALIESGRCPSEFDLENSGNCTAPFACFKCWGHAVRKKTDKDIGWY